MMLSVSVSIVGYSMGKRYTIAWNVTEFLKFAMTIDFTSAPDKQCEMTYNDGSPVDCSQAELEAIVTVAENNGYSIRHGCGTP